MISLYKYCLLSAFLVSGIAGCASSESVKSSESEPSANEKAVVVESAKEEKSIDKQIIVVINDRVKYTFTKQDTSWKGTATQFDSYDPETRKIVRVLSLNPTYGWSDFEDMVQYLKIYTLPDQTEIIKRKAGPLTQESRSYQFTVYDGETTQNYTYYNPEGEATNHWQSNFVVTFGSYIASEMNVVETLSE